ncbi:Histone acetyltransferase type B subunit 2 [Babesia sp. Xinjiang]|uniref:Histone acetyltransferase type B subunit 2 n=1 Tax=Babesia sp. Xinjiang TaxID=462227 RepID=UPI000A26541B|nr:Histone acetyltransferase type B subunit 2 [Babesia sp. Xinjiang]ORM39518.1 Histone acetyltransferase type B subunit 2 [Babesia sp. Xinjiang]
MESVILRGNALCKIKRKFPAPHHSVPQVNYSNHAESGRKDEQNTDTTKEQEEEYDNYYVWRRNAPFLYDTLLVHRLDWPSLVVDMVPDTCYKSRNGATAHKVLLGTHTSGNDVEYAIVAEIKLPVPAIRENMSSCENFARFFSYHKTHKMAMMGHPLPVLDIKAKLVHPGEVNRIVHCPGKQFTFVTHTNFGDLLLYDYSRHPSTPRSATRAAPQIVLTAGHTADGFGASWVDDRKLVSVATDGSVCTWDITAKSTAVEDLEHYVEGTKCVKPINKFNLKDTPFNDVQVLPYRKELYMAVADDCVARLYDSRLDNSEGAPQLQLQGETEVNCLSFNPFNDEIVATGEADGTISVWDMRKPEEPMILLSHHSQAVNQVEFCPASAGMLASASEDNQVCIWELSTEEKLRFVHAGHRAPVSDLSWLKATSMKNGFTLATTGADNALHCFTPCFREL